MIGLLTDTLLYGIAAFFLLGVITYFTFTLVRIFFDCLFIAPKSFREWKQSKRNNIRSFLTSCKNTRFVPVSTDIACALTITFIGVLYCLFSYVFLDGVLRLLPFAALLFGVYLLNISLGTKFHIVNQYIKLIFTLIVGYPFYFGVVTSRAICTIIVKIRLKITEIRDKSPNNV